MNKSHPFDDYFKKLNEEIAAQNRKWLQETLEEFAAHSQVDVSQLSESVSIKLPDVESIAKEITTQTALSAILDDTLLERVSVPTIAEIIDNSLHRTFVDTRFVEAFLDNFENTMAANNVAAICTEKLEELAAQTEVSSLVEERMTLLAEHTHFSEDLGELFAELAANKYFGAEFDETMKRFAANTDFSSLFSECIGETSKNSEAFKSLSQLMQKISAQADFDCLDAGVRKELRRSYERAVAKLLRDIETETFRQMPWDMFLDLTYGSLADDPIERPETLEPDTTDNT